MPTFQDDPVISRMQGDKSSFSGGVYGESTKFNGVRGVTYAPGHGAVVGVSENHSKEAGPGVFGQSDGTGVWGTSKTWMGVFGNSESTTGGAGVMGESKGAGVIGKSHTWHGVHGETPSTTGGAGVSGEHKANGTGVLGKSEGGFGVVGISQSNRGVSGESQAGIGVFGKGGKLAGYFEGDVEVTGDLRLVNADCAEDFNVPNGETIEPGTVMVLGEEECLRPSHRAYDTRVAGVISGAGTYRPGIVLDKQSPERHRLPVALLGKVFCKVDAQFGAIAVGDLLTTSSTVGHAMKTTDALKAFGAVIGKALRPLTNGRGLIPILIALQ